MTRHLAEFNFGTLRYGWGDPRIAGFENAIAQVNAIATRSDGFVWRMPDDAMEAVQDDPHGPLGHRPNTASTLSVWTGAAPLYDFVTKTLHARIMAGRVDWFVPGDSGFLVCWWVPTGHRPDVAEGMANWEILQAQGDSDAIFGGAALRRLADATL
ncbi:DUF3291 domain-containing protein [Yoonia sp. SS1-5]|uniref:DUF3291 domain-containing protein n=1 Tax=Yoonia rhodophyticola TaxID=3137370 RepID=A0AAN0MDF9_9RHOB